MRPPHLILMQHGLLEFFTKPNTLPIEGVLIGSSATDILVQWTLKEPGDIQWFNGPVHDQWLTDFTINDVRTTNRMRTTILIKA